MWHFLNSLVPSFDRDRSAIQRITSMRLELAHLSDDQLRDTATRTNDLLRFMAAAAIAASRILGQEMHDVQLRGALASLAEVSQRCKPARAKHPPQSRQWHGLLKSAKAYT